MNKILNWTFGACFRTLGRFLAIFVILALFLFIGSKLDIELPRWFSLNVNASTITSYDTYTNYMNDSSSCGTSGKISYTTLFPNVQNQNNWQSGSLNSTISGQAHDIVLSFNTSLLANSYYDVTINFMSNDLRYTVKRDNLTLYSGSSCQDFGTNNLALVSFTNNATSSKNTNQLKFRIYSSSVSPYWTIKLSGNSKQYLTSVNNFGIKNIDVTLVEDNSTEDIINNQTNNTENIINNNDANTEQIIENQNALLGSKCENLLGITNLNDIYWNSNGNATYTAGENLIITNSSSSSGYSGIYGQLLSYALVDNNKTYTISFDVVSTEPSNFQFGGGDNISTYSIDSTSKKITKTFTNMNYKSTYFVFYNLSRNSSIITITNLMVSEGTSAKPFCLFGTTNSKLDNIDNGLNDVNNSINDLNNSLTDSSTDNVDTSALGDVAGWLPAGPVDSILTLPLTLFNSLLNVLNNETCRALVITLPFVDSNITLPCINELYNKIGISDSFFSWVGLIASCVIMFNYLMSLYVYVDQVLTFRENNYPGYFDDNWGGGA